MAAYEVLLLNTAIPQIQAAQSGDTYVVPRDIAFSTVANLANGTNLLPSLTFSSDTNTGIYREGPDALGFTAGGGTNQMVLTSTGLGIGTTSPAQRLHVSVNTGGAGAFLQVSNTGDSQTAYFGTNTSGGSIQVVGANPLQFTTNGTERARITSGGSLLVGTTTEAGYLFRVVGGLSQFYATAAANFPVHVWNSAASGDNGFVNFYTDAGTTLRGSIDYDRTGGLVRYNTTSDYRAKDIIGPIQNVGATIDALKVYEGKMKGATQSRPMLVAHEAQEYAPYAVTGEKDAMNEDGTPKYQQMDVSSLVPLLIAELQSLRARVAQLEGK